MEYNNSQEKINPVRGRGSLRALAASNGVKQFIASEKGKDILTVLILILVGLGSFELGRLSKSGESAGVKVEYPSTEMQSASAILSENPYIKNVNQVFGAAVNSTGKNFFASSRGSKYYSIGCSAGKSIKQENRVYFATREDAERAGYELSSSCR